MSGSTKTLTAKQEAAIRLLLLGATHATVAQNIGAGQSTVRRWLASPEFQAAFREARKDAANRGRVAIDGMLTAAAEALRRNLRSGNSASEVRAAVAVFAIAKDFEIADVVERLAAAERRIDERDVSRARLHDSGRKTA